MAEIYQPRADVNSLFGTYTVDRNTGIVDASALTNASIYDKMLRGADGIQNKIKASDKIVTAMAAPTTFLAAKRTDLAEIADKLIVEFSSSYRRHAGRNLSIKQTRENVKKDVDELYDKLMKFHEQDYPNEVVQRMVKKMTGGN